MTQYTTTLPTEVREARQEVVYWVEEMQRLLKEPERGPYWQARWREAHRNWAYTHAIWQGLMERRN
jgi:hypothetical protein